MIRFAVSEGWRAFRNLGVMGLLTLAALTTTLSLLGLSLRAYMLMGDWSRGLLGRFEIEAFLQPDADSLRGAQIAAQVRLIPNIAAVRFISKGEAARRFNDQFGSELFDLVEHNPLPSSLIITLSRRANSATTDWEAVAASVRRISGVEDVAYQGSLLAQMRAFLRRMGELLVGMLIVALALSLGLTVITTVSAIRSRDEFLRVIAFAGGTRGMAWSPFLALGAYYGLCAGVFAVLGVETLARLVYWGWSLKAPAPWWWAPGILSAGILLGVTGAGWAAARRITQV